MLDAMFAADRERKAAADRVRREKEAAILQRIKTCRALESCSFALGETWSYDGDAPEPVCIRRVRVTIAPDVWGGRIYEAARSFADEPGFGVFLTQPLPDLFPESATAAVWLAAEVFFCASLKNSTKRGTVRSVRSALKALADTEPDAKAPVVWIGFYAFFRYVRDAYASGRVGIWETRRAPELNPAMDVEEALLVVRKGQAATYEEREKLRRGLCALDDPAVHVAAYFGDAVAMKGATTALSAKLRTLSQKPVATGVESPTPIVNEDRPTDLEAARFFDLLVASFVDQPLATMVELVRAAKSTLGQERRADSETPIRTALAKHGVHANGGLYRVRAAARAMAIELSRRRGRLRKPKKVDALKSTQANSAAPKPA